MPSDHQRIDSQSHDGSSAGALESRYLLRYLMTQWRRVFGLNISKVEELLFVGGEFRSDQWPDLYDLGIRAVLSLQAERADEFHGVPPLRTLRLHVRDFHAPTIDQLQEAVEFVHAACAAEQRVLIHCHAGVGRAPLTAAAYLIARGHSAAEALQTITRARPIISLNDTQMLRLIEWEQLLRSSQQ